MKRLRLVVLAIAVAAISAQSLLTGRAEQASPVNPPPSGPFDALHFRPIGPASMSGRISDLAVYETNPALFYVGTAHGGVWKTTNGGTIPIVFHCVVAAFLFTFGTYHVRLAG